MFFFVVWNAYVLLLLIVHNVGSQSDIGYKSSSGELNNESTEVNETDSPVSEQISKTECSESTNEPSGLSENEDDSLFKGVYNVDLLAAFRFRSFVNFIT